MSKFQSAYRPNHSTETALIHLCNELAGVKSIGLTSYLATFRPICRFRYCKLLFSLIVCRVALVLLVMCYKGLKAKPICVTDISMFSAITWLFLLSQKCVEFLRALFWSLIILSWCCSKCRPMYKVFFLFITFFRMFSLRSCVHHICNKFIINCLKVNPPKTKIIIFLSYCKLSSHSFSVDVSGQMITPSTTVKYFGVIFYPPLSFNNHVDVYRSSFSCFRSISTCRIKCYLDQTTPEIIINAFVFFRLDNCNAIFCFAVQYSALATYPKLFFPRLVYIFPRHLSTCRLSSTSITIKQSEVLRMENHITFSAFMFDVQIFVCFIS